MTLKGVASYIGVLTVIIGTGVGVVVSVLETGNRGATQTARLEERIKAECKLREASNRSAAARVAAAVEPLKAGQARIEGQLERQDQVIDGLEIEATQGAEARARRLEGQLGGVREDVIEIQEDVGAIRFDVDALEVKLWPDTVFLADTVRLVDTLETHRPGWLRRAVGKVLPGGD